MTEPLKVKPMKAEPLKAEPSKFSSALARLKQPPFPQDDEIGEVAAGETDQSVDANQTDQVGETIPTPIPTHSAATTSDTRDTRDTPAEAPKLNRRSKVSHTEISVPQDSATPSTAPVEPSKGRGRPLGKRSDPSYEPTTVLLRKRTKKLANRKLEDTEARQDLSDLIEQLLAEWIQEPV